MEQDPVKKRFRFGRAWLIFLVLYLLFLGTRGAWHQYQLIHRYKKLVIQIEEAKELNKQQKIKISRLQDPRYLEFLARDMLGLVKPGEKVYKLVEPEGGVQR